MTRYLLLAGILFGLLAVALASREETASAAGPCGTSHDSLSAEEQQFIQLVQQWRDTNLPNSTELQVSGALNAAAAWFAEWQVGDGAPGGHIDGAGRNWVGRALDCGYTGTTSRGQAYAGGSGEGIYAVSSNNPLNIGPAQAITGVTYPGSGIVAYTNGSPPFKCVGAAVYRNANSTKVAWVVVVAQYPSGSSCPASTAATPTPSMSPTTSATSSPTPTRTPSPTPTPVVHKVRAPLLSKD